MDDYEELLARLKQVRRGKVDSAVSSSFDVDHEYVTELAAVQAAIVAVEAVIEEAKAFL